MQPDVGRAIVVVPCYNEALRLDAPGFREFLDSAPEGLRLLFVDDGSRDGTVAVLQDLVHRSAGRAGLFLLERNQGKAEAVRQGMLVGLAQGAEVVGYWDADLATPLETIPLFLDFLRENPAVEVLLGSRVLLLGKRIVRKATRHYPGRVFATLASLMLGLPVYDTQCGAKLFRRTQALELALSRPFRSRWIFDVELLGRLLSWYRHQAPEAEGGAFYEYPLPRWRDIGGSRLAPRDFLRAALELAWLYATGLRFLPRSRPGTWSD